MAACLEHGKGIKKMKYAVIILISIVMMVFMHVMKRYRVYFLITYVLLMCALSAYLNGNITNIVPLYQTTNQAFYQEEFIEQGEYPDSLLPLFVNDKVIHVKNDIVRGADAAKKMGRHWLYAYYHYHDAVRLLKAFGASVIPHEDLNEFTVSETQKEQFVDLGYANDMFRYSFLYSNDKDEPGDYFSYYWYYSTNLSPIHVYVCLDEDSEQETIATAKELVAVWQETEDEEDPAEAEDLYLMTRAYFEKEVKQHDDP